MTAATGSTVHDLDCLDRHLPEVYDGFQQRPRMKRNEANVGNRAKNTDRNTKTDMRLYRYCRSVVEDHRETTGQNVTKKARKISTAGYKSRQPTQGLR